MHKKYLRLKTPAAALPALALALTQPLSSAAVAQEQLVLEEIIVSARKRTESLQTAPVSVSVFNAEALEKALISDVLEVVNRVPGFTMNADNITEPNMFMRGIGTDIESAGANPSIGLFLDEVYLTRSMGFAMDIFDVERVEVLRGPQGTLYGKNVVGGVINFVTKKPTEELDAMLQATVGNYNTLEVKGYVSGPLADNTFGKIAVSSRAHDGYDKNTFTDNDIGDVDADGFRGQLRFTPNEDLDILLSADRSRRRGTGRWTDIKIPSDNNIPFKNPDERRGPNNIDGVADADIDGFSLHVDWNTGAGTLTSITSYRSGDFRQLGNDGGSFIDFSRIPTDFTTGRVDFFSDDFDPSAFNDDYFVNDKAEQVDTISQEFRFASNYDGMFNFMLGVFYMAEDIERQEAQTYLFGQFFAQGMETADTESDNETLGVFGELRFDITSTFNTTVGLRYTQDDKDFSVSRSNVGDFLGAEFADGNGNPTKAFSADDSDSWDAVTPSLTLNWQASENIFLYAGVSKGFKSGGWNGENAANPQEAVAAYDEEFALNYELGAKTELFAKRLRLNVTAFHTEYEDLQTQQFVVFDPNLPADNVIANAGEAEVDGVELELTALVAEWWTLSASYAYMDAEITGDLINTEFQFLPPTFEPTQVDTNFKGNDLRRAPENSASLSSVWQWSVGNAGNVYARVDYSWTDDFHFENDNSDRTLIESFEVLDASIGFSSADEKWEVSVWGKNLTDELYETAKADVIGSVLVSYAPPRTAGVSVTWRY